MLTVVTAYYPTRTDVDIQSYLSDFQKLVATDIPILLFADPTVSLPAFPSTVRVLRRELPRIVPPGLEIQLPPQRNAQKDTEAFLCLMLQKLYCLAEALKETSASHLAWMDVRLFHVIRETEQAQAKVRSLMTQSFEGLTKLLAPGCWEGTFGTDPFVGIQWRFCGGVVLGPRAAIEPAYRRQMELVAQHLPRLTWEVNYWAMMEDQFAWYKADHTDSILMNLPETFTA